VEPAIGHLKSDHRMDRCWRQGAMGDALHSISCAAGYNLRWLLRAIVRLGLGPALLCRLRMALWTAPALRASPLGHGRTHALGLRPRRRLNPASAAASVVVLRQDGILRGRLNVGSAAAAD